MTEMKVFETDLPPIDDVIRVYNHAGGSVVTKVLPGPDGTGIRLLVLDGLEDDFITWEEIEEYFPKWSEIETVKTETEKPQGESNNE